VENINRNETFVCIIIVVLVNEPHCLMNVNFQVVIEGTKGPGYRGDIGIDDVNITAGACRGL
jgi:hypothetical protein